MKKTLLAALAFLAALSAASAADLLLRQDAPAKDWESQYFPIGNGSLGAMLNGGIAEDILQLNLDSLWSGSPYSTEKLKDNPDANYAEMGCYLPLGTLKVKFDGVKENEVKNYSRALNISDAVHTVEFEIDGKKQTREAFVSAISRSNVLVYHVSSETPVSGRVEYRDAREGITVIEEYRERFGLVVPNTNRIDPIPSTRTTKYSADGFSFSGVIPEKFKEPNVPDRYLDYQFEIENIRDVRMFALNGRKGLRYEVRARVVADGWLRTAEDGVEFRDCREITVLLAAESDYNPKLVEFTREEKIAKLALPEKRIADAIKLGYTKLKNSSSVWFSSRINNVQLDLGGDPELEKLTLAERVKRCREGKSDPGLVELMFQYGRYLLLSSSQPGSLPANLQGIWNNSNTPAWHSDYHTNINIQMNYWGAEPAALPECHEPLFDFMLAAMPVAEKDTATVLGEDSGFTFRTSMNSYGAGGWRWNWPSAAWIAQHFYRHWQYGADGRFLEQKAWPFYEGVAKFWFKRLKKRADGTYVVPQGWSPEHGPTEDGVTHDQQIVAEFFDQYLDIARELEIDNDDTKRAAEIRKNLLGNKIGSWGQLQEWETDRDRKGDDHRHTSHLFAVYPGSSIDAMKTPELFQAARVALEGRALTGDARRSWTWPWRAALWARLGDGEKATEMVNSLLRYNTLENLFTTHPPFQIDGNLGIVGAICEMLVQNDSGGVFVLPVDLPDWPDGSFHGLRVHGGNRVSAEWKNGRPVRVEIEINNRYDDGLKLRTRTPMVYEGKVGTSFIIPQDAFALIVLTAPEQ